MRCDIIKISENFWNIRGSFKIAGLIDVGTQASLVRLASGKFVFLDAYTLSDKVKNEVFYLTDEGAAVEAILNLHPFHTLHCENMHRDFPDARLYGTRRHHERLQGLPWESVKTEDRELHEFYSGDFEFSIPRGVDFISDDENVHFSSVLAHHTPSGTVHVDDTLVYLDVPLLPAFLGFSDRLGFHPTLPKVLEKRDGAVADFREWTNHLADTWGQARHLCAAHTGVLTGRKLEVESLGNRILSALERVSGTLDKHQRKFA